MITPREIDRQIYMLQRAKRACLYAIAFGVAALIAFNAGGGF